MSRKTNKKLSDRQIIDAVLTGRDADIIHLLQGGANVNAIDAEHEETLLMLAAEKGFTSTAQLLINNGASVAVRDVNGKTALMCAAASGQLDVVKVLLNASAEINASDEDGRTALFYAVAGADLEMTQLLLKHGANISVADTNGETALSLANDYGLINIVAVLQKYETQE